MKSHNDFSRSDRVGQQIHDVAARLFLTQIEDPRLQQVQIVEVDVSPDLKNARLYYLMLDGEEPPAGVPEALERVAGLVRRAISQELRLRYVPRIEFRFDEAVLRGRRIDELLSKISED